MKIDRPQATSIMGRSDRSSLLCYDVGTGAIAFSTRRGGGISAGNYASFNINPYCGDADENVCGNRKKLCAVLGITDDRLVFPHQLHTAEVVCIDEDYLIADERRKCEILEGKDALITSSPEFCIGVSTADCIPVLLHDPVKRVVAAVHAGWRGTVGGIAGNTVRMMVRHYGCRPEELRAVIGPGISLDAFEIGDEVYDTFAAAGFDMGALARRYPSDKGVKWHIDLWTANHMQLIETGLTSGHIHVSGICTYTNHTEFFSARRLGILSGRIFNGIMLTP